MRLAETLWILLLVATLSSGCISVARLEDLPSSSESLHYGQPEKEEFGYYEYEFSLQDVTDEQFVEAVRQALSTNDFHIRRDDLAARVITADRGLRANEWHSVVGVYSRRRNEDLDVKILFKITQDFTGTLPQSYAENIADRIRTFLHRDSGTALLRGNGILEVNGRHALTLRTERSIPAGETVVEVGSVHSRDLIDYPRRCRITFTAQPDRIYQVTYAGNMDDRHSLPCKWKPAAQAFDYDLRNCTVATIIAPDGDEVGRCRLVGEAGD